MNNEVTNPYERFLKRELARCSKDPVYFIENYFRMEHPTRGIINFELYDYQKDLIELYAFSDKVISKLPRQSGKTMCAAGVLLWKAIFQDNFNIMIGSCNTTCAKEILNRIHLACINLPHFFGANIKSFNKSQIEFENNSTIFAYSLTGRSARGQTLSAVYLDEFAFVEPHVAEQAWLSILPTLVHGGKCIVTSTPMFENDPFDKIWKSATDVVSGDKEKCIGVNGFKTFSISWKDIPRIKSNKQFEQEMREALGDERWKREYECEVS